jgi:hypothetical protein
MVQAVEEAERKGYGQRGAKQIWTKGASVTPSFSRRSSQKVNICRMGPRGLENRERTKMSEHMSRRKALSLLGLGAALGFTLSAVMVPSEAEAQEAAPPAAAPAEATGTHGMQRRQGRRTHRHERRNTRRTGQPATPAAAAPPQ